MTAKLTHSYEAKSEVRQQAEKVRIDLLQSIVPNVLNWGLYRAAIFQIGVYFEWLFFILSHCLSLNIHNLPRVNVRVWYWKLLMQSVGE